MQHIILNGIRYVLAQDSDASTLQLQIKNRNEIVNRLDELNQQAKSENLSTRNSANVYQIPTDKDAVWLNLVPQKTMLDDSAIRNRQFEFYVFDDLTAPPEPEQFVVDGQFFRCAPEGGGPKKVENYTYYFMNEGKKRRIPNYKTLEVMLVERGKSLLDVRVLESNQCTQIPEGGAEPNKASQWKEEYSDLTNLEALAQMEANAQSAEQAAQQAAQNVTNQVNAVKAEAEAAKAEAEAAKEEAAAAKAASAAAEAAAAAREAEAAAKEAEFNAQINSGT